MVDDISHEGLRALLREEGVTFQRLKTWKASKDPRYAEKKARVGQLYAIADRNVTPGAVERSWRWSCAWRCARWWPVRAGFIAITEWATDADEQTLCMLGVIGAVPFQVSI